MTWLNFSVCLGSIYGLYYLFNIIIDSSSGRGSFKEEDNILFFSEDIKPKTPTYEENNACEEVIASFGQEMLQVPQLIETLIPEKVNSSGGLTIKEMFHLAKGEAIEFTKAITY